MHLYSVYSTRVTRHFLISAVQLSPNNNINSIPGRSGFGLNQKVKILSESKRPFLSENAVAGPGNSGL